MDPRVSMATNCPCPRFSRRSSMEWTSWYRRCASAQPGEVHIVSLSPTTNLALALVQAPDIAPRIGGVVMMAGASTECGNITPAAEFNVYVDPEAADIVLRCGAPIAVLPLDVTHKMLSTPERLNRIRSVGTRCAIAIADMLTFSQAFD